MSDRHTHWDYPEADLRRSGIYRIVHIPTGREYIGQAQCFIDRWINHRSLLRGHRHGNKRLEHSWHVHGEREFQFFIIEFIDDFSQLDAAEQRHIDTREPYYNICLIAGSVRGYHHTDGTRTTLRQRWQERRNRPPSPRMIADYLSRKGRKQRPEIVARRNAATRGKIRTPEHRLKYSQVRQAAVQERNEELRLQVIQTLRSLQESGESLHSLYQASRMIAQELGTKINNIYRVMRLLEIDGEINLPRFGDNRSEIHQAAMSRRSPEAKEATRKKLSKPQTEQQREANRLAHFGMKQSEATKQKRKETWMTHVPTEKELAHQARSAEILASHRDKGIQRSVEVRQAQYLERQLEILCHLTEYGWETSIPCGIYSAAVRLSNDMGISIMTIYDILRKMEVRGEITSQRGRHRNTPPSRPLVPAAPFVPPRAVTQGILWADESEEDA